MRTAARAATSLLGLVLTTVLAACSPATDGLLFTYSDGLPAVGFDAQVAGELILVADKCYGLRDNTGREFAVAFPPGTEAVDGGIKTPSGTTIALGETISTNGAHSGADEYIADAKIPDECAAGGTAVAGPDGL